MFTIVWTLLGWFVWIDWPVLGNKIESLKKVHWGTSYDWLQDSYDIGSLFYTRSASRWRTSCWLVPLCKFTQREVKRRDISFALPREAGPKDPYELRSLWCLKCLGWWATCDEIPFGRTSPRQGEQVFGSVLYSLKTLIFPLILILLHTVDCSVAELDFLAYFRDSFASETNFKDLVFCPRMKLLDFLC